jgi:hypothetical protein
MLANQGLGLVTLELGWVVLVAPEIAPEILPLKQPQSTWSSCCKSS